MPRDFPCLELRLTCNGTLPGDEVPVTELSAGTLMLRE